MTDSLKERLAKLSGAGFNPIYSEALARIEGLERDRDFLIKHAHHIDDMDEIAVLKATIAKLEGENKRLRGIDEWIDNELSKVTMLESRVTDRDETIATLQGKLDRAITALRAAEPYLLDHIAMTLDEGPGDRIALDEVQAILSDLSPKDQGHE